MKRRLLLVSALLILVFAQAFAAEADQMSSIMAGKGLSSVSFDVSKKYTTPTTTNFNDHPDNELFTFLSTIETPTNYNDLDYPSGRPASFELHISPSGENSDGFYFIHESNKTKKVSYTLGCQGYYGTYDNSYMNNTTYVAPNTDLTVTRQNSQTEKCKYTFTPVKDTSNVITDYILKFPGVYFYDVSGWSGYIRARIMWMFKFFLYMNETNIDNFEEGYYTSYIRVHMTVTGNNTARRVPDGGLDLDEVYCIRAHYSVDMQGMEMEVFTVSAGPDAYNMDLEKNTEYYNVMSILLSSSQVKTGSGSDQTKAKDSDKIKYVVYLSPTNSKSVSGSFKFNHIGSEHLSEDLGVNAISYDLYITTTDDIETPKISFPTKATDPTSTSTLKSPDITKLAGTQGIGKTSTGQYYIYPSFVDQELRSKAHTYIWSLNAKIWVRVLGDTSKLKSGLYQSKIYVIVETTT